jgi:DNA-directed RNA polymerase specialized sigma24 family protein
LDQRTYRLLKEADWKAIGKELLAFAEWRAWNYKWRRGGHLNLAAGQTTADIVQEVIVKTINGDRRWDPDKGPLMPWLKDQVRSLIDHLHQSEAHYYERAMPESDSGEELSDQIEYRASKAESPFVAQSLNPEEIMLRKEEIEQRERVLFEAVNGDQELMELLEAFVNAYEPKSRYLADEMGIPVEDVYNQVRRLRRRASKLMKGDDS